MQLTILAASGGTGRELARQALERGHTVTAIARTPGRIDVPDSASLTRVAADVRDPDSMKAALRDSEVVLSGLGVADGDPPGTLTAGARAVTESQPQRIVWLGPLGNGPLSAGRRTVGLDAYPRRIFPAGVSRATVAAAMLDEAESPRYQGAI